MADRDLDPATVAVSAGRGSHEPGAPANVPITVSSVYRAGAGIGVTYGRVDNPTWAAFEEAIGALEGGIARAFASGMGAISAVLDLRARPDAVIVAPADAYTGTRAHLAHLAEQCGGTIRLVDIADTGAALAACDGADLLWIESPTNPLLAIADIPALVAGAHHSGALCVVDSTFATPLGQRPLADGADVVVHSATKLIAGHSDVLLGLAVTADEKLAAALHERRTLLGAVPGPFETWLALRGLRTLPVRLERAQATAVELVRRLGEHRSVARVRYPGQGTIVSFEVAGGAQAADATCEAARLIVHTTSLGGTETTMERRAVHPGEVAPPHLVRISVGLETVADLWADLDQALTAGAAAVTERMDA